MDDRPSAQSLEATHGPRIERPRGGAKVADAPERLATEAPCQLPARIRDAIALQREVKVLAAFAQQQIAHDATH